MAAAFWALAPVPFLVHAAAMLADEAWFHRRRGLPRWERWGHPADTLTVLLCYAIVLALPPTPGNVRLYVAAAAFSTLFVTKDEWIHARACGGGEAWLHALLFALHPVLLFLLGAHWAGLALAPRPGHGVFALFVPVQAGVTALFLAWQLLYWNGPWAPASPVVPGAMVPAAAKASPAGSGEARA